MNVMRAAVVGDVETVKQWLSAPQHRRTGHAGQVLLQAASNGHDSICQLVLNSGHVSDDHIALALSQACFNNQLSTAQLLVRHGHLNTQHLTEALSSACRAGHLCIVKWLISDVMALSHTDRITWLLIAACARGDMSDIQQLATQVDSDVTRVMSEALRVACRRGRDNVVKWLTSHTTADVSNRGVIHSIDGEVTSLMVACDMSRCDIVRRLLQCVTPHTVNMMSGDKRNTALHYIVCSEAIDARLALVDACAEGNCDTAVDVLDVSDVNLQATSGYTALHWACGYGHVDIVRILLSKFASTDITDDNRHTPAMCAEVTGHTDVLPYLQCLMSVTPDNLIHVSDNNTTVSISVSSVTHATKSNTSNTKSHTKPRMSTCQLV